MSPPQEFSERLRDLFALPGATFTCVVDAAGGEVLEAAGPLAADADAVGAAAATAARLAATAGSEPDELDDLMVVSKRCYHLMRPLDGAAGRPVIVYLRLDRARSNLALARRALAGLTPGSAPPGPALTRSPASMPSAVAVPRPRTPPGGLSGGPVGQQPRSLVAQTPEPTTAVSRPSAGAAAARPSPTTAVAPPSDGVAPARPAPLEPTSTPLPRRPARAPNRPRPRPPSVPDSSPSVLGQRWADDVGTLRRLLVGLRALGGQ